MKLRTKVKRLKADNERLRKIALIPKFISVDIQRENAVQLRAVFDISDFELDRGFPGAVLHDEIITKDLQSRLLHAAKDFIVIRKRNNPETYRREYVAELYIVKQEVIE